MTAAWSKTAAFYGFFFFAMGAHLPFWPLWLRDWGLTEAEVGYYLAIAVFARLGFGVLAPWLADLAGAPRRMLAALAAAGAALFFAHLWVETRLLLLIATLATAAVIAGITPIVDALSLRAASRSGFAYATARSVGSAAFLTASLACGLAVAAWGPGAVLWFVALSFPPLIWLGLVHPGGAGAPVGRPRLAEAGTLLRSRIFMLALIAGAAAQGGHAVIYAYGSIHWKAGGLSDGTIGALWALGVVAETAVMALWGRRMIEVLGASGALALANIAGLARWGAMLLDPGLVWLWPLQALHGLTFTAAHLGALAFLQAAAPPRLAATAQGLAGSLGGGLAMAAAGFLAAWAYPAFGVGAFWISVGLSGVGLVAALALGQVWRGERLGPA